MKNEKTKGRALGHFSEDIESRGGDEQRGRGAGNREKFWSMGSSKSWEGVLKWNLARPFLSSVQKQ